MDINGEQDSPCERSFIVKDKILSTSIKSFTLVLSSPENQFSKMQSAVDSI